MNIKSGIEKEKIPDFAELKKEIIELLERATLQQIYDAHYFLKKYIK